MRIDVWFDLVCPFCHLGRRHLDLALEQFEHGDECAVVWHSFELDRSAPAVQDGSTVERVAAKYGVPVAQMVVTHERMASDAAAVGLDFRWQDLRSGNSFDAHRVLHLARSQGRDAEVMDRLMRAWYSEGAALGDRDTLVALATEAGMDAEEVRDMLGSDDFGTEVRTDEALANQIGVTAVPTFVLDQKYAVTGAQPVDALVDALRQVWADQGNPVTPRAESCGGGGCGGGGCGGGGVCGTQDAEHAAH